MGQREETRRAGVVNSHGVGTALGDTASVVSLDHSLVGPRVELEEWKEGFPGISMSRRGF